MSQENEPQLQLLGRRRISSVGNRHSPRVNPIHPRSHFGGSTSIPTRLHLNPTSSFIPPSPPHSSRGIGIPHGSGSANRASSNNGVPFVPNLTLSGTTPTTPVCFTSSNSPYLKNTKSAIDAAISHERERIRALELQEVDITSVEDLKAALKKERQHSRRLVSELAHLKSVAVASTLEAEVHEEGRINCLMRRLDGLQKEKGRIIVELEREEEMLTNTLQKKLNEVRREKAQLEKQIEREHIDMTNKKLESLSTCYTNPNPTNILSASAVPAGDVTMN